MSRFDGVARVYGPPAARLEKCQVMVIGLGGVGSWTVEALARSGIGGLMLVDGDEVCISNTNRQLHALKQNVGRPKTEVMAERVRQIHPACHVECIQEFFRMDNREAILDRKPDFVVDAVDGVTAKALIIGGARDRHIPVITCGAAGGKTDPTQVQIADLADVHHDRLMMFVRKKLRKHHGVHPRGRKTGIPCVFSPEAIRMPPVAACADVEEPAPALDETVMLFDNAEARACEGRLGALCFVTGAFGFAAAAHVINELVASPLE